MRLLSSQLFNHPPSHSLDFLSFPPAYLGLVLMLLTPFSPWSTFTHLPYPVIWLFFPVNLSFTCLALSSWWSFLFHIWILPVPTIGPYHFLPHFLPISNLHLSPIFISLSPLPQLQILPSLPDLRTKPHPSPPYLFSFSLKALHPEPGPLFFPSLDPIVIPYDLDCRLKSLLPIFLFQKYSNTFLQPQPLFLIFFLPTLFPRDSLNPLHMRLKIAKCFKKENTHTNIFKHTSPSSWTPQPLFPTSSHGWFHFVQILGWKSPCKRILPSLAIQYKGVPNS